MAAPRRKRSSATVNLIVSLVFHAVVILGLAFLAAREGLLGKQLKTIAVTMAPKEKPPEPEEPKEPDNPPEPPPELPREDVIPQAATPPPPPVNVAPPPPAAPLTAPPVAPPPVGLPAFNFADGAKVVESTSDPVALYRGYVEFMLRSRWVRPDGVADERFVAEVEFSIGPGGEVVDSRWQRGSGHTAWDNSVREAIRSTRTLGRPPPREFPPRFLVRFDVAAEADASGLP
ncbi:MAG: TonB C-terminal domain-containing protein [Verrucomicrobiae bacterium]|nr:TonB C-terminal domain-containing protein [Verrucomicrobiae bacterium]